MGWGWKKITRALVDPIGAAISAGTSKVTSNPTVNALASTNASPFQVGESYATMAGVVKPDLQQLPLQAAPQAGGFGGVLASEYAAPPPPVSYLSGWGTLAAQPATFGSGDALRRVLSRDTGTQSMQRFTPNWMEQRTGNSGGYDFV